MMWYLIVMILGQGEPMIDGPYFDRMACEEAGIALKITNDDVNYVCMPAKDGEGTV